MKAGDVKRFLAEARARGLAVTDRGAALPPAPPGEPAPPAAGSSDLAGLLLAVRAAGFGEPEPEHPFAPPRRWRFDLAWVGERVAFEREGGDFRPVKCDCGRVRTVFVSRHHSRDGLEKDVEKYTRAMLLGWLVVRGTPGMLRDGRAAGLLIEALETRRGRA